jgi:hypothetical protein
MKKRDGRRKWGEGGVGKDAVPVQLFLEIIFSVLFGLLVNHITYLGNSEFCYQIRCEG